MMSERSPLAAVLDELGLSTQEAALAASCSPQSVSGAKSGQPLPMALRQFLNGAGVPVGELEQAQARWREAKGSEIRSRVFGRGGDIPAHKMVTAAVTK